jgi:hypothetical protein
MLLHPENRAGVLAVSSPCYFCRLLNQRKQHTEAELEARGEDASNVSVADFVEESSAFVVHHTSILRNKRLLCTYM